MDMALRRRRSTPHDDGLRRRYQGGDIAPGEEMADCSTRWATLAEVNELVKVGGLFPGEPWVFERALQCFDLWFPPSADGALPGWETGFNPSAH